MVVEGQVRVRAVDLTVLFDEVPIKAKVGFRLEGRALRYLKINGVWEDHDIFALTSEDWQAMQAR